MLTALKVWEIAYGPEFPFPSKRTKDQFGNTTMTTFSQQIGNAVFMNLNTTLQLTYEIQYLYLMSFFLATWLHQW